LPGHPNPSDFLRRDASARRPSADQVANSLDILTRLNAAIVIYASCKTPHSRLRT
jgi:hypothetical protein